MSDLDKAYRFLRIPRHITRQELKRVYTRHALKYHPDKPTGNPVKFRALNAAYREVKEDLRVRDDTSFHALKTRSTQAADAFFPAENPHTFTKQGRFDQQAFTTYFDERYQDPVAPTELPPEPPPMPTHISGDVSEAYDHFVTEHAPAAPPTNALAAPRSNDDPGHQDCYRLGVTKVADHTDHSKPQLLMTDYRKAYTLEAPPPTTPLRPMTREALAALAEDPTPYTPAEQAALEEAELAAQQAQAHLARNQDKLDQFHQDQFRRHMFSLTH
jgi:hypothetical protein